MWRPELAADVRICGNTGQVGSGGSEPVSSQEQTFGRALIQTGRYSVESQSYPGPGSVRWQSVFGQVLQQYLVEDLRRRLKDRLMNIFQDFKAVGPGHLARVGFRRSTRNVP